MKQVIKLALIEPNKGQIPGVPKNPRLIKDAKFALLKQSIQEDPEMLDLRGSLVFPFNGKFVAIGGNMRYYACKELGYEEMPCEVIPEDTPAEKLRAYSIKDNASFGEWDYNLLANEWEIDNLASWGLDIPEVDTTAEEEEAEEDNFDVESAIPKTPITKPGDIWILGRHRLICGSATEPDDINKLMNGQVANLVVTDPPYNVNYEGGTSEKKKIQNDNMGEADFKKFLLDAFTNMNAHLKPGGSFYIWHPDSGGHLFRNAAQEAGWRIRQCLIWKKNALVLGRQDYQWIHEPCLYGWKDGAAHYFVDERANTTAYEMEIDPDKMSKDDLRKLVKLIFKEIQDEKLKTSVIEENKPSRSAEHPTMKPVKLIGRLIKNSSKYGQIVLDLFGGSGTTLIASEQLGRTCYISELTPIYCDVIVKRWETLTEQVAVLLTSEMQ